MMQPYLRPRQRNPNEDRRPPTGRLKTPEWEKWFTRRELERLLRRHCRQVSSRPISYWEDMKPEGLFLAWLAVK
jgi:malonyl-CoA O-methyltransferase